MYLVIKNKVNDKNMADIFKRVNKQEQGQILIYALIIVALCSLVVVSLVNYMGVGLRAVNTYHMKTNRTYAADAGIQYALWKIKYGTQLITDRSNNVYTSYSYNYPTIPEMNKNQITTQVSAVWLFGYLFRIVPGATPHCGALITTSEPNYPTNGVFTISFENPTQNPIVIQKFGIWLPPGISYNGNSSGITSVPPTLIPILGGTNVVWDVVHSLGKESNAEQRFSFLPNTGVDPHGASSWVFPQQQAVGASWDASIWWYNVTSTAADSLTPSKTTSIEALVVNDNSEAIPTAALISYLINP